MSSALAEALQGMEGDRTALIAVVMEDVDHTEVMTAFARQFPEEFSVYMSGQTLTGDFENGFAANNTAVKESSAPETETSL